MIDLVHDLEPTVGELLDRHLAASKEWFPHEVVPWGQGRDFDPAEAWDPDEHPVPDAVRSALFVNLLTEDNLPYYFSTINRIFGADGAWGTWARRWTAEEGRHSIAIRDYLTVTRLLDPRELERARMHQVGTGVVPEPDPPIDGLVYVALQELATRIAHRATGRLLEDRAGYDVMARVGDRREPPLPLLPRPRPARPSSSIRRARSRRSSGRCGTSRCPAPASPASRSMRSPSPRRASTTCRSTTTRSSCPSCSATGTSPARRPRRGGRAGPHAAARTDRADRPGRAAPRRALGRRRSSEPVLAGASA